MGKCVRALGFALLVVGCSGSSSEDVASDSGVDGSAPVGTRDAASEAAPPSGDDAGVTPQDAAADSEAGTLTKASVVFTKASVNTNADTSNYSADSTTSAGAKKSQTEVTLVTSGVARTATFFIESPYMAGHTYALSSPFDNAADEATLAYTDHAGQWYATSGTVTIESVNAGGFVFHVKDAAMVQAPNDKSVGTFTLQIDGPTKVN